MAIFVVVLMAIAPAFSSAQAASTAPVKDTKPFEPFEHWRDLVLKGDATGLRDLYSMTPVARIKVGADGELDASSDIRFWTGLKATGIKIDVLQQGTPEVQPGAYQVLFRAEIKSAASGTEQTYYITQGQLWREQDQHWRMVVAKRTAPSRLEQPASNQKNIYPSSADAKADIKQALQKSGKEHKRVLVVFGANWRYDCHVLDLAFERQDIAPVLGENFLVVHVDVGQGEKNQDLMKQYEVPMDRGIPAIAVLDSDGKLIYSQKNGEFQNARALGPEDVLKFLNEWKPGAQKG
jgi:hypothetical protein